MSSFACVQLRVLAFFACALTGSLGSSAESLADDIIGAISEGCEEHMDHALSFRQLRALPTAQQAEDTLDANLVAKADSAGEGAGGVAGSVGGPREKHDSPRDLVGPVSALAQDGLPGGWGEAAEWAAKNDEVAAELQGESSSDIVAADEVNNLAASLGGRNIKTLYHQTSEAAGWAILKTGFRPGHSGWCGGGIYFAISPEATNGKAIGPDSQKGFIIEAKVDLGRVDYLGPKCAWYMTGPTLRSRKFDSIRFDPGDGPEHVVYSHDRVLYMRRYS